MKRTMLGRMAVFALVMGMLLTGCPTGGGGPGPGPGGTSPNVFTITGITTQLRDWSQKTCVVGMYPQNTTAAEALSDTKRIYGLEPGLPQFIVAGREVYHNTATGPTGNWTQSGTLKSPGNKFANDWRGSGTFTGYWLLQDSTGKYRGYQLKVPKTISAGETTTVHAVNDFKLVLEE